MNRSRVRDWGLLALLLAAAMVCIRLGFWQLARLEQRSSLNQIIQNQLSHPLTSFSTGEADYQRILLEGIFLPEFEILLENRALNEVAGYHLVTPLLVEQDRLILVDRGWIPYETGSRFELDAYHQDEPVHIQAVLRPSQAEPGWKFLADPIPEPGAPPLRSWRVVNIEGIQAQIPMTLHHQFAVLTKIEPAPDSMPTPDFQVDLTAGPHLSYAIQWFSFAAITLIGGSVILRRSLRNRS